MATDAGYYATTYIYPFQVYVGQMDPTRVNISIFVNRILSSHTKVGRRKLTAPMW